jgi:flagellar protein FliS
MNKNRFTQSYTGSSLNTASPAQITLMLFDGALRFMNAAEQGFALQSTQQRMETVHNSIVKAQNIVAELQSALDMEKGGEFSKTMFNLYDYMLKQLQDANIQKDPTPMKIVQKLLKEIRDAWDEMLQKNSAEAAEAANKEAASHENGAAEKNTEDSSDSEDSQNKIGGSLNTSA